MSTLKSLVLPAAIIMIVGGCATSGWTETSRKTAPRADGAITLEVENHNASDVIVYLLRYGSKTRVGEVRSMSRRAIRLPRSFVASGGPLQLQLRPLGSNQGYLLDPIMVQPGQRIALTVQNHLPISSYMILSN